MFLEFLVTTNGNREAGQAVNEGAAGGLGADFLAATQVMVYVGGILVLIIFGVMLTNRISGTDLLHGHRGRFMAGIGSFLFFGILAALNLKDRRR